MKSSSSPKCMFSSNPPILENAFAELPMRTPTAKGDSIRREASMPKFIIVMMALSPDLSESGKAQVVNMSAGCL